MDAAVALADLTEISSQVEAAAVVDGEGNVLAAAGDGERLASVGRELLEAAEEDFGGRRSVTKLEVALRAGSVFGTCLESIDPPKSAKKARSRAKKEQATADA
jgi:hypothetical protein